MSLKLNQLRSIHAWIRATASSEIVFVSALILPLYLLLYNAMIDQINVDWKNWGMAAAVLLYAVGIIWMKNSQSRDEKDLKDLLVIKNHILDKGFQFMAFDKILEIDSRLTEERVRKLLFVFPNEIRLARLKGDKRGIKILNIEVESE